MPFRKAGTYVVTCGIHPKMRMNIVVKGLECRAQSHARAESVRFPLRFGERQLVLLRIEHRAA